MPCKRRSFTAEFKTRVVRAALREDLTIAELAKKYDVHPNQISTWKQQALDALPDAFASTSKRKQDQEDFLDKEAKLYQHIGQLQFEVEWLKKKAAELGLDD